MSQPNKADGDSDSRDRSEETVESAEPTNTSRQLLRGAKQGKRSAVQRLFGGLLPELTRWTRGRLPRWARRRVDTDDVVQDAFAAVFRRLDTFEPRRKRALRAYLRQAIQNRIRDEVRRAGQVETSAGSQGQWSAQEPTPLSQVLSNERHARYQRALGVLSSSERELVVGRIELDYSYPQLALATGKPSPDAARVATRRAILRLATAMDNA